jgi:hypothetical protein
MQREREFALAMHRIGRQPARQFVAAQRDELLELLGQLAPQRDPALAELDQVLGQGLDSVRRFEQHAGVRLLGQPAQRLRARRALGRQETGELEGGIGLGRRQSGHAQQRRHAAGARQRDRAQPGGLHRRAEPGARVADARRAGVADIGDAFAALQPLDHADRGLGLVVLMQREQGPVQPVGLQQAGGVAGVLAGDRVDQPEQVQRAQRDVGQIADRGGHHIERPGGIMLRTGCRLRGAQRRLEGGIQDDVPD